ncbi:hypothetical protein CONLIGDRAFT_140702 [Coniochaeta ligniaria NRRL 30616]|uniref:C2H2-type domain-containing protein n=1 Tax=Coniochaeta ligniaria NRRL 30616 TaxID=1408157 RepID=A0A1J7I8L0_9PEZI|nr:hypothetical protein CONLIGDRAFT_140702 [Coniochaeta ligniaria NRRL 30616]
MSSSMMSSSQVAFEPRDFMHDGNYPPMGDHHVPGPDADTSYVHHEAVANELADGVSYNGAGVPSFDGADDDLDLDTPPAQTLVQPTSPPNDGHLQQRVKAVPKPNRVAVKNADGKFVCDHPGCEEEVREFLRKCEWSKHMDKHERPYRCNEDGCEKLPGFTYSGGLLRHEREVHGKHGGPKKPLTCPHPTCKRFAGKPFSRQENLNEHLRRVHTQDPDETQAATPRQNGIDHSPSPDSTPPARAGQRRKRGDDDDSEALRQEVKRLKQENNELRQQVTNQTIQTSQLISQLHQAQAINQANAMGLATGPML